MVGQIWPTGCSLPTSSLSKGGSEGGLLKVRSHTRQQFLDEGRKQEVEGNHSIAVTLKPAGGLISSEKLEETI